jgi:uncharacterized protein YjbI with pentapeptide repeats
MGVVRDSWRSPRPDNEGLSDVADNEHMARLKQGVDAWNAWRRAEGARVTPDLSGAELSGAHLSGADLTNANLSSATMVGAELSGANLSGADLRNADLRGANLSSAELLPADLIRADLSWADLSGASLTGTNLNFAGLSGASLTGANLHFANLSLADLSGADLTQARLAGTIFADTDLNNIIGLETCTHGFRSTIDPGRLQELSQLPLPFLRGIGLPEALIDYLPSLLNQPLQYYFCLISYSSKDQDFADRIYADLQNKGVRCWFAPHDLPIGGKILDEIDAAIRLRDKLLLILSEHSIKSGWVEDEVSKAFAEERKREQIVLFPVRLDDVVIETNKAWAAKLRDQRNIGDFTRWKEHSAYQKSFGRVLRDLAPKPKG